MTQPFPIITQDESLATLQQTMMDYSDTGGDHHMQASHAIKRLREMLSEKSARMNEQETESALSDIRDVVDARVEPDHADSIQWNLIGEISLLISKEQLMQAFEKVMAQAEIDGSLVEPDDETE